MPAHLVRRGSDVFIVRASPSPSPTADTSTNRTRSAGSGSTHRSRSSTARASAGQCEGDQVRSARSAGRRILTTGCSRPAATNDQPRPGYSLRRPRIVSRETSMWFSGHTRSVAPMGRCAGSRTLGETGYLGGVLRRSSIQEALRRRARVRSSKWAGIAHAGCRFYCDVVPTSEEPKRRIIHSPGPHHRCTECGGRGRVPGLIRVTNMGKGMGTGYGPCPTCEGLGYVVADEED